MTFNPFNNGSVPTNIKPSNPTGTVSATLVMMGLACQFTPTASGIIEVTVTGFHQQATGIQTNQLGCRYGTGVAPINGAAVTGTRFGSPADPSIRPPSVGGPTSFAFTDILSLVAGTTYWFDIALLTGSASDSASINNVSMSFKETR